MLLIGNNPAREAAYGTPEFEAMMAGYCTLNERISADADFLVQRCDVLDG